MNKAKFNVNHATSFIQRFALLYRDDDQMRDSSACPNGAVGRRCGRRPKGQPPPWMMTEQGKLHLSAHS